MSFFQNKSDVSQALEGVLPERPRLLLVDDQPANIQVLYEIFADDFEVFMATSGNDALGLCKEQQPDVVLLDIIMPGMDGLEVCRRLKADDETREIPIIFVTGQSSPEEEAQGLEAGAVDFITKPVNPAVVRARVRTHVLLKAQADALRSMAFIDGLTTVANRRYFDERLANEWLACRRQQVPLGLILLDVDHFKLYNDHYGHQLGDECLKALAAQMKVVIQRPRDMVARYGGEEFVCLLPDTDEEGVQSLMETIRKAVENLGIAHEYSSTAKVVTVSLGGAITVPDASREAEALVAVADAKLYEAKAAGRNCARLENLE